MPPTFPYSDTTSVDTDFGLGSEERWTQMPKVWDIHDDSYSYAPPKPEGDPWDKILAPLMEKDQIKCSAWKEEVQNLLIFAGLFSAVVTAFIIESYKLLQPPSPDTTMLLIRMLADQRVASSNISMNSSSPVSSSAIRINIFWFISLMLSLASVLIGIISMQWIREYQSYPSLSARETLALFNMRSEAFKTWHVEKIFAALPLLLQAALVLFFGGIIDFLSQLRREVAVPVTVVIGIILLFLVATTLFPTMQCLALFLSAKTIGRHSKPSQCPYKSPQSWTFHSLHNSIRIFCSCLGRIFCMVHLRHMPSYINSSHVLPQLNAAMEKKTWVDFDLAWLSIRDACVHGSERFDPDPGLNKCRAILNASLPLYDISKVLQNAIGKDSQVKASEESLSVVYHCYHDIAASFLTKDAFIHASYSDEVFEDIQRCYRYLSKLLNVEDPGYHLSIRYDKMRYINIVNSLATSAQATLYNRHLYGFLASVRHYFVANNLCNHILEIKLRLMKTFYGPHSDHDYHIRPIDLPSHLPTSLRFYPYEMRKLGDKTHAKQKQLSVFYWQYYHLVMDYFKCVAYSSRSQFLQGPLHYHPDIVDFLESASQHTYSACSSESILHIASHNRRELSTAYSGVLRFLSKVFRDDLAGMQVNGRGNNQGNDSKECEFEPGSIDLFYTSAIYVQHFLTIQQEKHRTSSIDSNFNILRQEMTRYRTKLLRIGSLPNKRLEDQLKSQPWDKGVPRFSDEWWSFLDINPRSTSSTPLPRTHEESPTSQQFPGISRQFIVDNLSESGGQADISNSVSSLDVAESEYDTSDVLADLNSADDNKNPTQAGKSTFGQTKDAKKKERQARFFIEHQEDPGRMDTYSSEPTYHSRSLSLSIPPIIISSSSPRSASLSLVTNESDSDSTSNDNETPKMSQPRAPDRLQPSDSRAAVDENRLRIPVVRSHSVPGMRRKTRPPI